MSNSVSTVVTVPTANQMAVVNPDALRVVDTKTGEYRDLQVQDLYPGMQYIFLGAKDLGDQSWIVRIVHMETKNLMRAHTDPTTKQETRVLEPVLLVFFADPRTGEVLDYCRPCSGKNVRELYRVLGSKSLVDWIGQTVMIKPNGNTVQFSKAPNGF